MDELINYVTESPENTNPNVVRSLASQISASSDSSDVGGVFIVHDNEGVLDRTFREIQQAVATDPVIIHSVTDASRDEQLMLIINSYIVNQVYFKEAGYCVDAQNMSGYYKTSNIDGYPTYETPK